MRLVRCIVLITALSATDCRPPGSTDASSSADATDAVDDLASSDHAEVAPDAPADSTASDTFPSDGSTVGVPCGEMGLADGGLVATICEGATPVCCLYGTCVSADTLDCPSEDAGYAFQLNSNAMERCDGREDCAAGGFCLLGGFAATWCAATPVPSEYWTICHGDADCPSDEPLCGPREIPRLQGDAYFRTCTRTCTSDSDCPATQPHCYAMDGSAAVCHARFVPPAPYADGGTAVPDATDAAATPCPGTTFPSDGSVPGDASVPPVAPRPITPRSVSRVASRQPTLHWAESSGSPGGHVEICSDRACSHIEQSVDATSSSTTTTGALSPGVHYWRVRAVDGTAFGPTWEFFVSPRDASLDTSWGTLVDIDGDAIDDFVRTPIFGETRTWPVYLLGHVNGFGDVHAFGAQLDWESPGAVPNGSLQRVFGSLIMWDAAGDVNGDGHADVVVAANGMTTYLGGDGPPLVHLFLGAPCGFGGPPATTLHCPAGCSRDYLFGRSVAGAGDVNGDGYSDIVVGSTDAIAPPPGSPLPIVVALVYLGGANGLSTSPIALLGNDAARGGAVLGAGDLNADGYADIVVGHRDVYFGGPSGPSNVPAVTSGVMATMSDAADIDGDGFDDLLASDGTSLFVSRGSASGIASAPSATIALGATFQSMSLGDFNGDGRADVAFTAAAGGWNMPGRSVIYFGSASGLQSVAAMNLPHEGVAAGDVNADGFDDFFAGRLYLGGSTGIDRAKPTVW